MKGSNNVNENCEVHHTTTTVVNNDPMTILMVKVYIKIIIKLTDNLLCNT